MATRAQEIKQLGAGNFTTTRLLTQHGSSFTGTFMNHTDPNPFEFPYAASTSEGEKLAHKKDTRRFIPPDRVRLAPALPNIIRHRTREMSARGMKVLKDPSSYVHINLDDTKVLEESHDVRTSDLQLCETHICSGEGKTSNYMRMRRKAKANITDDTRSHNKAFWIKDGSVPVPRGIFKRQGKQDIIRETFWSKSARLGKPQGF